MREVLSREAHDTGSESIEKRKERWQQKKINLLKKEEEEKRKELLPRVVRHAP
jgi:hypothetical protein